jgi:murein DD-endopeptidase MepM/ murein hydrolase activator NlpD
LAVGQDEFHNGIDIACSYGTPVLAVADGTVTFAGWDGYWGRRVQINHGFGVVTFCAHNSKLTVSVGDTVKKGEIIAYSGNSGRSTGSHVHYTAYVNGQLVDPLVFTTYSKEQ